MQISQVTYGDTRSHTIAMADALEAVGKTPLELCWPRSRDLVDTDADVLVVEYCPRQYSDGHATPAQVHAWAVKNGIEHVIEVTDDTDDDI